MLFIDSPTIKKKIGTKFLNFYKNFNQARLRLLNLWVNKDATKVNLLFWKGLHFLNRIQHLFIISIFKYSMRIVLTLKATICLL